MGYRIVKRLLDIIASVFLIVLFCLPLLVLMACIRLTSEGAAIFKQKRVGRNGKVFVCYKLRTMYENAPPSLSTAEFFDAERYVTPIGRLLRRTSLDELPQLLNVLKGDMSIIGPRPLIPEEKALHQKRQERGIYSIRPGMTGLAQVKGRDMLTDSEKLVFDCEYVNNMSLLLDLKILFFTAFNVVTGKGVGDRKKEKRIKG